MKEEILSYFKKIYPRINDTHKGDYGRVFVLAGSLGMTGAAHLCSISALRAGAGLVYLGIPESLNEIMEVKLTEVITVPLPETKEGTVSVKAENKILEFLKTINLVVIGPGLSRHKSTKNLIRKLLLKIDKPTLLDADGINAFESNIGYFKKLKSKSVIVTPHIAEFSRLFKISIPKIKADKETCAKKIALDFNLTCVLKGYRTVVASKDGRTYINDTGNPGMATAGSGDVLTGLIAGLRVQGLDDFESCCLGVYIHGRAGDICAQKLSELSLVATDILDCIPFGFKELIESLQH